MSWVSSDTILLTFLLFCRIGGCLMLVPGFSSSRIPVQVRLFLAIAVTLALAPLVLPMLKAALRNPAPSLVLQLVLFETATGMLIGLMARFFFLALQFMATSVASFVGYGNLPGSAIEDEEPLPSLASMITLTAAVLLFLTEQHWEIFRGLIGSYAALPVTEPLSMRFALTKLADTLSNAFLLALQISSPFVVYALIVNFLFGIANKLVPQVPIYFISLPFVIAGGLLLLYFTLGEFLRLFAAGFASWLQAG
jgi:flagellar biosynthetic protein FliR